MREFLIRRRAALTGLATLALVGAGAAPALAQSTGSDVTVDYSKISQPVESQITSMLPEALTLLGIIAAVLLGVGIFRRVTGAKKASG